MCTSVCLSDAIYHKSHTCGLFLPTGTATYYTHAAEHVVQLVGQKRAIVYLNFVRDVAPVAIEERDAKAFTRMLLSRPFLPISGKRQKSKEKAEDYRTYCFCLKLPHLYVQTLIYCSLSSVLHEKLWCC